jgi:hypothetical protein
MSGIKVFGLTCAIISVFEGAAALIQKKKEEKKNAKRLAIEQFLAVGPPRVQTEYDHGFPRLGQKFARGYGQYTFPSALSDHLPLTGLW